VYVLVIGNRLYSTWSLRVWALMKGVNIPFEEKFILLSRPETDSEAKKYSPTGLVPTLLDDKLKVWDSLAITEYLAERHPDKNIWPIDIEARASARSVAAAIHSGTGNLGFHCPMNLGKLFLPQELNDAVRNDIDVFTSIIRDNREKYGGDGPFLFGKFSAADAFLLPLMTRIRTYGIEVDEICTAYGRQLLLLPFFIDWSNRALKEDWVIEKCEVDAPVSSFLCLSPD